jgi:hypothetical protein
MSLECNIAHVDRYRLTPVRDARARDERVKRNELADAVGDACVSEAQVAVAAERVTAARAVLATAVQVAASAGAAGERVRAERFVARCRRDLDDAAGAHARAADAHAGRVASVDTARGTLARARADREVIERHFARWREAQKRLIERRDD